MFKQTLLAAILFSLGVPLSAWGQSCSDQKVIVVEKLPFDHDGYTCNSTVNFQNYRSATCPIPDKYTGPDVVYKLRLNQGNEVSFLLKPKPTKQPNSTDEKSPDLVLALLTSCTNEKSCLSSSADFIGPDPEQISAVKYAPGDYYLHVDAERDCGNYTLEIKGVNPLPDLQVGLSAPHSVIAGDYLTYTLSVSNQGQLDADVVHVTQTLPDGVDLPSLPSDCALNGRKVVCTIKRLVVGGRKEEWQISVRVKSDTRKPLISDADASAIQEDPTPNHIQAKTDVDLEIKFHPTLIAPATVTAGSTMTYALSAVNNGKSDATKVTLAPILPEGVTIASVSKTCNKEDAVCEFERIPSGGTASALFTLNVSPAARGILNGRVKIEANGVDPVFSDEASTTIVAKTDLVLTNEDPPSTIRAGDTLVYKFNIKNKEYSRSTGSVLTDVLPPELIFQNSPGCSAKDNVVTCSIGDLDPGESEPVTIETIVDPASEAVTLNHHAFVTAKEDDDVSENNKTKQLTTTVIIKADLELTSEQQPTTVAGDVLESPVCAGKNLLYTFKVENHGPSQSRGGAIRGFTLGGLNFVSSPDGCSFNENTGFVSCQIPPLPPNGPPFEARIVAVSATALTVNPGQAKLYSDHDDVSGNDTATPDSTSILTASDLTVTLSVPPLVKPGDFTYSLDVTNKGPSTAESVQINFNVDPDLPPITVHSDPLCVTCTQSYCICTILPDKAQRISLVAQAPAMLGKNLLASAFVDTSACDPDGNRATASTTVSESVANLALTLLADRDYAVVGDTLQYTLQVANQGFDDPAVRLTFTLPSGVSLLDEPDECEYTEGDENEPPTLSCEILASTPLTVKVLVDPDAGPQLQSTASLDGTLDSYPGDDSSSVTLKVLRVAPLVLPYFEVSESADRLTTRISVHNPTYDANFGSIGFKYVALMADRNPVDAEESLASNATRTLDLFSVGRLQTQEGYIGITPIGPAVPRHALTGDFIRLDRSEGSAGGERLITTDTVRTSPGLCSRWSARFSQGPAATNGTDFLFFVPGNRSGSEEAIVTGKVYNKDGVFVEEIRVDRDEEAFKVTPRGPNGRPLLTSDGSIEWTFRDGRIGHITAVHRTEGSDEIMVPGFCQSAEQAGASSLLLPHFDVSSGDSLFAVHNETEKNAEIQISYFNENGEPIPVQPDRALLPKHAISLVDLQSAGIPKGFATVEAYSRDDPATSFNSLSGEYLRTGVDGKSGAALVNASTQLCRTWSTRLVQGVARSETRFLVYREEAGSLKLTAFKENGDELSVAPPSTNARSFLATASEMGLDERNGSVKWDLGTNGYVATLLSGQGPGGLYSMLIPGVCLDKKPD